eukprot:TRINITY_DN1459_c1_g1_i1.p1 TRINITY_DN1459_c1_g1~~TRINITY_DN1459_c1_g1_i1.p1  ORF type:complete len:385 (+),score=69.01 TRINITY_DN1459_c1_g1_i1:53-1156(+)
MWDWIIGGSAEKGSPPEANPKLLAQENRRLRRFNATLLEKLREREEEINARQEEQLKNLKKTHILEEELALSRTELENLTNIMKNMRKDAETCRETTCTLQSLELSSANTVASVIRSELECWQTILRLHQITLPEIATIRNTVVAPLPPSDKEYCVILDIDETQVHFCLETFPLQKAELRFRSGLETSLRKLCSLKHKIDLGIWTAGVPRYAKATRDLISMIAKEGNVFDWTLARDLSWTGKGAVKKDLSALGRNTDKVLLIDNARKVVVQKQNTLIVTNFYSSMKGGHHDDTLIIVSELVEELSMSSLTVPDFLKQKADEGSILCQGGYYYVPTTWSPSIIKLRKELYRVPLPSTLGQLVESLNSG